MISRFERIVERNSNEAVVLESSTVEEGTYVTSSAPTEVTHWTVWVNREPVALLPRPEEDEFYSLEGFEGEASPSQLDTISPAWLKRENSSIEILTMGQVTTT